MKFLENAVRWFVGVLFIFSGLVKLNDPAGTSIKMEEYFEVFAGDIASFFHYFVPFAMAIGLFVVILEVLLGVAVLINYQMKITSLILLLLIIFFTFLTFYSAAFDKVTDCGCFGDAIPLTPWQSFSKDILLLIFSGFLFLKRGAFNPVFSLKTGHLLITGSLAFCGILAYYAIEHLPPIDFRPYKIGADIPKLMQPSADFEYKYVMEKDGEKAEFSQYPSDTSYTFIEMVLMNPEAQPKITDYNVWNADGDFTDETFRGAKLLILISDIAHSKSNKIDEINKLTQEIEAEVTSFVVTAADEASFENFRHEYQLALPYYFADGTVIKAMVRANPGLILMKDGVVLGKWHNNDIPTSEDVKELIR